MFFCLGIICPPRGGLFFFCWGGGGYLYGAGGSFVYVYIQIWSVRVCVKNECHMRNVLAYMYVFVCEFVFVCTCACPYAHTCKKNLLHVYVISI